MPWIDSGDSGYWVDDGPAKVTSDWGDVSYTDYAAPQWAQDLGFSGGMGANTNSHAMLWNPTSNNGIGQWLQGEGGGLVNQGSGDSSYDVWQAPTSWKTMDRDPNIDADKQSGYNGTPFTQYGANGENQGTGTWQGLHDGSMTDLYVTMLLAAGAGAIVGGAGAAAGAGAESGAGGAAAAGAGEAGAAGAGGYGTVTTSGGGSIFGNAMGAGASMGPTATAGGGGFLSSLGSNPSLWQKGLGAVTGGGGGASGGGSTAGGYNMNDLASLFGGGLDYYNQNKASGDMLAWLKQRAAMTDNLYNPGTPEADLMRQTMERKDAMAGRNSQYGVRETDLAAKMAQIKADANTRMTTGVSNNMAAALNQKAAAPAGLMAALQGSGGGGMQNYSSLVSSLGSGISDWWTGRGSDWASGGGNYSQYLSDDYGQYF